MKSCNKAWEWEGSSRIWDLTLSTFWDRKSFHCRNLLPSEQGSSKKFCGDASFKLKVWFGLDLLTFGHFSIWAWQLAIKCQNTDIFNLQWSCFIDFPSDAHMCRGEFCFLPQWVSVYPKYKWLDRPVTWLSLFGWLSQSAVCLGGKTGAELWQAL